MSWFVAKERPRLSPSNAGVLHPPTHAAESLTRIRNDSFLFSDVSMLEFAEMPMQLCGASISLWWTAPASPNIRHRLKSAPAAARDADTAELSTIIEDQLRLKLKSAKAPIEILVNDHAEKPTGN